MIGAANNEARERMVAAVPSPNINGKDPSCGGFYLKQH